MQGYALLTNYQHHQPGEKPPQHFKFMKTKKQLHEDFRSAFAIALKNPKDERVIIETYFEFVEWVSPKTGKPVYANAYYMIDGATFECAGFHTEARTDEMWQVTSSKGYGCDAHPLNVAAWAALMIERGLVKKIYNDVY